MKRYLLFGGSYYYPNGGMNDFKGDFNCPVRAESAIKKEFKGRDLDNWWAHIYDTELQKTITINL